MRKIMVLSAIFCSVNGFAACPPFFGHISNTPPPVIPLSILQDGSAGAVCLGQPPCVFSDAMLPPPQVTVSGQDISIEVQLRHPAGLTPTDCGSNSYITVGLPPLATGNYQLSYILKYVVPQFGEQTFQRSGSFTVGQAPSSIPTLTFPGILLLLTAVGMSGLLVRSRT